MMRKKIRFAYRLIIDNNATLLWDKYVFEDSYKEYLLQHQKFNTKENPFKKFRTLLAENEKANQLHFLVGISIEGYITQLKGNLYNVPDLLGNTFFPIANYQLDIINTDITDITKHKIGVTFYSQPLIFIDIIDNCYLVSKQIEKENNFDTLMFPLQKNLSICYYEIF